MTRGGVTDGSAAIRPPGADVSVVVPACDEGETVGALVAALLGQPRVHEVLVVDDGSTDGTAALAEASGARVVSHGRRRGNGAAIKSGLAAASGPVVAILDGDGQHDPDDLPRLLEALDRGADLVVARRVGFNGSGLWRGVGNHLVAALASYVARAPVPDLTSGFRVFRCETMARWIPLLPDGFSTPTTSTLAFLHAGHVVRFVPVAPLERRGSGRTHTRLLRDGPRLLTLVVRVTTLFHPWRARGPVLAGLAAAATVLALGAGARAVVLAAGLAAGPVVAMLAVGGVRLLLHDRRETSVTAGGPAGDRPVPREGAGPGGLPATVRRAPLITSEREG